MIKIRPLCYIKGTPVPPTPPVLPPFTIRLKFKDGVTPSIGRGTGVQVSSSPNIWDWTYNDSGWNYLFQNQTDIVEVIAANTTGVTGTQFMFDGCNSLVKTVTFDISAVSDCGNMYKNCVLLEEAPYYDTSNIWSIYGMYRYCYSLKNVPLYDVSNCTGYSSYMFEDCYNVEGGALALYQQFILNPPSNHEDTFKNCGRDTTTGAAELAQIPDGWK